MIWRDPKKKCQHYVQIELLKSYNGMTMIVFSSICPEQVESESVKTCECVMCEH